MSFSGLTIQRIWSMTPAEPSTVKIPYRSLPRRSTAEVWPFVVAQVMVKSSQNQLEMVVRNAPDVLHQILGLGGAAEHAVGDAEQPRAHAREGRRGLLELRR